MRVNNSELLTSPASSVCRALCIYSRIVYIELDDVRCFCSSLFSSDFYYYYYHNRKLALASAYIYK